MPFIKNISLIRRKGAVSAPPLTISVSATATGSAGYFTSSNNRIYTGATAITPIYITYGSSVGGGTAPYTIVWTSSLNSYPTGYVQGTNTSSFTGTTYAGNTDTWTATVTDSSTPPNVSSASIDTIVYGTTAGRISVNTNTGNDTQSIQFVAEPGGGSYPLKTISAAILYAVPNETTMSIVSGTYNENPFITKNVQIQGSGAGLAGLGTGNYFVYATKTLPISGARNVNIIGFTSGSFDLIGVSPSGSLQTAIQYDVSVSGTVYVLPGNHEVTTTIYPISAATIRGEQVETGSSITNYPVPSSVIRFAPTASTLFYKQNSGDLKIENLALEIETGSFPTGRNSTSLFIRAWNSTGSVITNMIQYRLVDNGVSIDLTGYSGFGTNPVAYSTNYGQIANWNIANYIGDLRDTDTSGNTYVYNTNYGPISESATSRLMFYDMGNLPSSVTSGALGTVQTVHNIGNSNTLISPAVGNRPALSWNDSFFEGKPYTIFDGSTRVMSRAQTVLNGDRISVVGFSVFQPNVLNQTNVVVNKYGNSVQGYSVIMTGSNVAITLYTTASVGTSSVFMTGNVGVGSPYIVEFFFNSSSLNRRVGIALYGTSSLITSSYFGDSQFTASIFSDPVPSTPSTNISVGGRSGHFRTINTFNTSAGLGNYFGGKIAMVIFDGQNGVHSDEYRRAVFYLLKKRYFPTGSTVTHSLFT